MGGPLSPFVYLAPLWRYGTSKIMGSRLWPFGVTWRHHGFLLVVHFNHASILHR